MPDHETLVIANGGIRTEADSREMMNLDAMEPSLVLLRRDGSGQQGTTAGAHEQRAPPRRRRRRHGRQRPAVRRRPDGPRAAAGDQAARQPFQHFPLGEAQRQIMNQYTASLAIHDELRLLAVTAPRGNKVFIWDRTVPRCARGSPARLRRRRGSRRRLRGQLRQGRCRLFDCRGERFTSTPLQMPAGLWDNHLRIV